jgi:hypothetical protein
VYDFTVKKRDEPRDAIKDAQRAVVEARKAETALEELGGEAMWDFASAAGVQPSLVSSSTQTDIIY